MKDTSASDTEFIGSADPGAKQERTKPRPEEYCLCLLAVFAI